MSEPAPKKKKKKAPVETRPEGAEPREPPKAAPGEDRPAPAVAPSDEGKPPAPRPGRRPGSGLAVHVALLAVALAFALFVWTREKNPSALSRGDVVVWSASPDAVQKVAFEGKKKKVVLEAREDKAGRYFVGTVDKEVPAKPAAPGDEGTEGEEGDTKRVEAPAPGVERQTTKFVSVSAAEKLAELVAPLRAVRALGRVDDARAAEFGLKEPEATLSVTVDGRERRLLVGGSTPGGFERYVKDEASGEVYVVRADLVRDLDGEGSRLMERDLHEFKDTEVTRAEISVGERSREVARGGEAGKRFWADASTPAQNDETIGNWMAKLERLRPTEYAPGPLDGGETVLRVEYEARGRKLGFVELVKRKAEGDAKPEYYVVSERTRLPAKVPASVAEQVEQDAASVVR